MTDTQQWNNESMHFEHEINSLEEVMSKPLMPVSLVFNLHLDPH